MQDMEKPVLHPLPLRTSRSSRRYRDYAAHPGRQQRNVAIHRFGEAFYGGFRCGDCCTRKPLKLVDRTITDEVSPVCQFFPPQIANRADDKPRRATGLRRCRLRSVRLWHDAHVRLRRVVDRTKLDHVGAVQPSGNLSRASSSLTDGTMMTSSPACQLTGVATLYSAVSSIESRTRRISSTLRPVLIG